MSVPVKKRADYTGREAHYTPAWVVDALLQDSHCPKRLRPREGQHWVDAGAGDGAIYRAVMRHGGPRFTLIEPHINDTLARLGRTIPQHGSPQRDVRLSVWVDDNGHVPVEIGQLVYGADIFVSNPPFSLAVQFVEGARAKCPDADIVILQRLGWIDEARESWLRAFWPDKYIIPRRVKFLRPSGGYHDGAIAGLCAWFHWPAGVGRRARGVTRLLELQGTGDLFGGGA